MDHKKRILILFLAGFSLAPFGDYAHLISETLSFAPTPLSFWGVPFWVPLKFGLMSAVIGMIHPWLDKKLEVEERPLGSRNLVIATFGILIFLTLYVISGFLRNWVGDISDQLLALISGLIWIIFDRSSTGIYIGVFIALVGTIMEILLSGAGIFTYLGSRNKLYGVVSWLPWLYFAASVTVGNLGRALANLKSKSEPS